MRQAPIAGLSSRIRWLVEAADIFATAQIDGLEPEGYLDLVARVSGVPRPVVDASLATTAAALRDMAATIERIRPTGVVTEWDDPAAADGTAVWVPRGHVFAVHTEGNTPGVHSVWPEALALGYQVVVHPSNREPFTASRLVSAIRATGFGNAAVSLLPCDDATAQVIVSEADFSQHIGDDDPSNRRVLPESPGRSKMLITADARWQDHIELIARAVTGFGGAACIATTSVLVEHDASGCAEALAHHLSEIPTLPPQHPRAILPAQTLDRARHIDRYLRGVARDSRCWLGGDTVVAELDTGGAVLRPAVHEVSSSTAPQLDIKLPFPCVWVAPWSPADGIGPLCRSVAVTVLTDDRDLIEALVREPTISNVYAGPYPTTWMRSTLPHNGYLADLLMRTKSFVR
ncbi:aldehyde dehydrogenase family protein [Nocardia goodfellowii]|uniref:Acyl-CoA reductase-like NAD-dependent aldehyde dehydrogenase n=1 Tax=Nocardia goodfellowii TaxID=882446 RepID=A0ABS4QN42_9NOCA|nr:aldehyde dehydrogenase family protein [Nocardia goodfellowii]MBP2193125.1 acyl-CoA reductase-like NAD-dependent aldehyde dehydrogenase [Nocardia goodfellowii]